MGGVGCGWVGEEERGRDGERGGGEPHRLGCVGEVSVGLCRGGNPSPDC